MFLGLSPASAHLAHYLIQHPEVGFAPIGYLDSGGITPVQSDVASLGPASALITVVEEHRPDWIVLARRAEAKVRQADDFAEPHFSGVQTEDAARFYEKTLGRVCAAQVRPEALIYSESLQPGLVSLRLQSMFTYVIAILALPLLLLLLAAVAIFGPPHLPRTRPAPRAARRPLRRTLHHVLVPPRRQSRPPACCTAGLHALPQIWNVLRGEMSFVGPQPDRPAFAAQLNRTIPFHAQRTAVRPGMTGWAQISQIRDGSEGDALRRLEYDMYFIKNVSLLLDLFVPSAGSARPSSPARPTPESHPHIPAPPPIRTQQRTRIVIFLVFLAVRRCSGNHCCPAKGFGPAKSAGLDLRPEAPPASRPSRVPARRRR